MLRYVLLDLRLYRDGNPRLNTKGLLGFLDALTYWNEIYLDEHPDTPPLYQSGVRYALPEPFQRGMPSASKIREALLAAGLPDQMAGELADTIATGEHFRDIPALLENRRGDCDNVAAMRAAELRTVGVDASVCLTEHKRDDGGTTYHAFTRWPDGTGEDPSRILGMGGRHPNAMRARVAELANLAERRENLAASVAAYQNTGRSLSGSDLARLRRLATLLMPPTASSDEVASWERAEDRAIFAAPRVAPKYLSFLPARRAA